MTADVARIRRADVLAGNTFGIVHGDTSGRDKLMRLVALIPVALEVEQEARLTIRRLRERVEELEKGKQDVN